MLKPPPETPLTAYLLADAFAAAGLPEGVLSVLPGDREVGAHLVRHPQVDKIAFTGSTAAGRQIMADCALRIARQTLELGGKSPAIVLDDADIEHVVRTVIPMAFTVNGQLCMAQSRILVPRERQADFADALTAAFAALPVGDPFAPDTQIGPLSGSGSGSGWRATWRWRARRAPAFSAAAGRAASSTATRSTRLWWPTWTTACGWPRKRSSAR